MFSGWDKFGTLISKFEDKWWDIDIKNITVSLCDHTKCKAKEPDAASLEGQLIIKFSAHHITTNLSEVLLEFHATAVTRFPRILDDILCLEDFL